jgi:hypothetical protein
MLTSGYLQTWLAPVLLSSAKKLFFHSRRIDRSTLPLTQ